MPGTEYIKIPQKRVGALIGSKGEVKKTIEKATPVKHIFNGGILPCIIKVRNAVT